MTDWLDVDFEPGVDFRVEPELTLAVAALELAGQGLHVFPLQPRGKVPLTEHGLADATVDRGTIETWWSRWPLANIGLRTGDLVVVDEDEPGAFGRLAEQHGHELPATRVVRTHAGRHYYFAQPNGTRIRNSAGKLAAGIDTRGDGGYVVAPPSVHPSGGRYEVLSDEPPAPLPGWIVELLTPPPAERPAPAPVRVAGATTPYGTAALEQELAAVAAAAEGTRNDRLNTAAFALGQLVAGGEVDEHDAQRGLEDAAQACGLPTLEAERTIRSGLAGGVEKPRRAPEQPQARPGRQPAPLPAHVVEQPFVIRVYSAPDLAALELPQSAEQVTPHTRRAMITLLGGITGHGKSTWSAHEIRQAAENGAHVLVVDLEQHLASVQRLIREAGLERSSAVDYAPIPEGLALNKRDDHLAAFETVLAGSPTYDLLVIDPFYKLHQADSNDELQARLLVALLRRWIAEHGFAILTATHCRKLPAGRNVITLDDFYGSSVFTRDPELIVGLQRHGDLAKLHVFKSREPDFQQGQVFELLFNRERGFYPKPTVDPEERAAEIRDIGDAAREWIAEHPGESTNRVKKAIAEAMKVGGDKVEEAIGLQVKSGLLPAPVKGSRNSRLWYPLNHAALTSPQTLLSEVTEADASGPKRDDFTRPSDLYVVETEGVGEVDEAAEVEQLADLAREHE